MQGPLRCKYCDFTIYFDKINGKIRAYEDEYGTLHLCKGFKNISFVPGDYRTYENLLKAFIANQQTLNQKINTILQLLENNGK